MQTLWTAGINTAITGLLSVEFRSLVAQRLAIIIHTFLNFGKF